jgi:hypothetical protein
VRQTGGKSGNGCAGALERLSAPLRSSRRRFRKTAEGRGRASNFHRSFWGIRARAKPEKRGRPLPRGCVGAGRIGCVWLRALPRSAAFCGVLRRKFARILEGKDTNPLPSTTPLHREISGVLGGTSARVT